MLKVDNKALEFIARDPVMNTALKHMRRRHFFVREQEEKPPSASDCGAVDSAAAEEEEEDADGAEPKSKRSRQAVAFSSSSTRQPITLACGHIAEALALSALDEVQSLVDDVVAKRIAPRSKGVDYGSVRVLFERGNYSLSMRPDMCACE